MLVAFFSLLLFTGGNASEPEQQRVNDDVPLNNRSMPMPGGNASEPEPLSNETKPLNNQPEPTHREENRENCRYDTIIKHLNLTENIEMYSLTRPVEHYARHTWVYLEMKLYAILDVKETEQKFVAYIWIDLDWDNDHIRWDPSDFCGLDEVIVPTKLLWMPDLTIEEMTEKDKTTPSTNVKIKSNGWIEYRNDQVIISTCKMYVYKFPFDIQSCHISFKSVMYSDKELELFFNKNNTEITLSSQQVMETEYEWIFLGMTVTNKTVMHFGDNQTMIVYTINMKRRSVLYIVNFLVPIIFFLCLDMASFLMSDSGGEKVGFKITVLLAVTVMQLILNEILPCSSDSIPLIAVFCMGVFSLMLLSLLETIVVIYLMDKDSELQEKETKRNQSVNETRNISSCCFTGIEKWSDCGSIHEASAEQSPSMTKEGTNDQLTEVSLTLEKMADDLGQLKKLLSNRKEDKQPGPWTRVAKRINKIFTFIYVPAVFLFLIIIWSLWLKN